MNEILPENISASWLMAAVAALLIALWIVLRRRRGQTQSLAGVLNSIAFERIQGLVIPKADEGEIQIDHLILTAQGLLIIDIKDVEGAVFGGDKMQDWTVIGANSRFTFSNPQPALYDRIAAVRQIVRQVPVSGRIVFLEGATFSKGIPSLVCNLDELLGEFGDQDKAAAKVKIEAFKPHWEQIQTLSDRASA